jgi:hypothetical protein
MLAVAGEALHGQREAVGVGASAAADDYVAVRAAAGAGRGPGRLADLVLLDLDRPLGGERRLRPGERRSGRGEQEEGGGAPKGAADAQSSLFAIIAAAAAIAKLDFAKGLPYRRRNFVKG